MLLAPHRLESLLAARRVQVIDLRPPAEWQVAHIPGSRNVEVDAFPGEAVTLDRELPIVFYAGDGSEAVEAAEALRAAGMTAYALDGGLRGWMAAGRPVQSGHDRTGESE